MFDPVRGQPDFPALEASIAAYRRGMELMKHCQAQLADAEQQIRILENGQFRDVDRDNLEGQ